MCIRDRYIDSHEKEPFWQRVDEVRATGCQILWEPPTKCLVDPEVREKTWKIIDKVDTVSYTHLLRRQL